MRQINPRLPSMMLAGIRLTKYRGVPDNQNPVTEWTRVVSPGGDVRATFVDGVAETREVSH